MSHITILGSGRTVLTADGQVFVNNSTGSDSNPGTIGAPYQTLQHAWDLNAGMLDLQRFNFTINLAGGTGIAYLLDAEFGWLGGNTVNITGAGSSTTTIQDLAFGSNNVYPLGPGAININKVKLTEAALGYCCINSALGTVNLSNRGGDLVVGTSLSGFVGLGATQPGSLLSLFDVTFNGYSGTIGVQAASGGFILGRGASTLTVVGSPSFSQGFAVAQDDGIVEFFGSIVPGTATGPRFDASGNGTIDTNGGGLTYFPGNANGTLESGGVYI